MKEVKVGKSKIHGKGLFSNEPIKKGDLITKVHAAVKINPELTKFIPNELGKFYNHTDKTPNVSNEIIGDGRYLRALKSIPANTELAADYREHSEMEQPEDFDKTKYASFDYDDTFTTPEGLAKAKELFNEGYNLFIISARDEITPEMVLRAQEAGIPRDNIIVTGSDEAKVAKVKALGIQKHFDNKSEVINQLGELGEQFRRGGIKSKKYTSNLLGKNRLFVKNGLLKKKSVKNKIYDPNSPYFEDGGYMDLDLDENQINEYKEGGYIVEELDNYTEGGEPCEQGFERDPVTGECVEKTPLENCEDGRCEETDQIQNILDEGSYIPKKNINLMWDVVDEMDKRDPFGNAGKIWTGKGAQSLSKRLGMDNPANCMWAAGMGYQCLPETKGKLPLMPFESNDKFINAVNKGTIPFSRVAKTHDPNFASQETGMLQQGDIINFKGAGNSHAMTFSNYREDGVPIFLDSNGNATDFGFNAGLWKDFLPNKEKVAYVSRFNPEKFYEKDIKTLEEKARTNPTMIEKQFGGPLNKFIVGGEPDNGVITQEEIDAANTAMMKARLAYANEFGNPAAKRMINIPDETYEFTGDEPGAGVPAGNTGTHFMSSMDNYAVPFIQQGSNGLYYNQNARPEDKEAIKFDSDEDANYFAEHYKDVSPGFINEKKKGGALLTKKVTCKKCGWTWDAADGGNDMTTCHKCGGQGLVHAKYGELNKFVGGGEPCEQGFERDPVTGECVALPERTQDIQEVRTNQYSPYIAAYEQANPRDAYVYQKKADYLRKNKGLNKMAGLSQDNFNTDVEGNFNSNWEYDKNSEVIKQFAKDHGINPKNHVELVEKMADKGDVSRDMIANSKYGSKLQPSLWARSLAGAQELGNFVVKQLPGEQGDVFNKQTAGLTKKEWDEIHNSSMGALETLSGADVLGAAVANSVVDLSTASGGNYQESPGILSGELKSNVSPLQAGLVNPLAYTGLGELAAGKSLLQVGKLKGAGLLEDVSGLTKSKFLKDPTFIPEQTFKKEFSNIYNPKTKTYDVYEINVPQEAIPGRSYADVQHKMKNLRKDLGIGPIEHFINKKFGTKGGIGLEKDAGMVLDNETGRLYDSNTRYWLNREYGIFPKAPVNKYQLAKNNGNLIEGDLPYEESKELLLNLNQKEEGGSMEMDLTREQINEYKKGGWIVEEIEDGSDPDPLDPHQAFLKNWYENRVFPKEIQKAKPILLNQLEQSFPPYVPTDALPTNVAAAYNYDNNIVELNKNYPAELQESSKTHENNHYLTQDANEYLDKPHTNLIEQNIINPKDINTGNKEWDKAYKENFDEIVSPEEMHSRIMTLRELAGFKPDQVITEKDVEDYFKSVGDKLDPDIQDIKQVTKGNKAIVELLNYMASNNSNEDLNVAKYGGTTDYELGDEIDEDTMKKLKKLGYTFEII